MNETNLSIRPNPDGRINRIPDGRINSAVQFGRLVNEIRPSSFYLFGRPDLAVWVSPEWNGPKLKEIFIQGKGMVPDVQLSTNYGLGWFWISLKQMEKWKLKIILIYGRFWTWTRKKDSDLGFFEGLLENAWLLNILICWKMLVKWVIWTPW